METKQDRVNQWKIEGRKLAIEAMCSGEDLDELRSKLHEQCEELGKKAKECDKELRDYYELLKSQGITDVPEGSAEYKKFHFLKDRVAEAYKSLFIINTELMVLLDTKVTEMQAELAETKYRVEQLDVENNFLEALKALWEKYHGNGGEG